ncbi:DinB family protein [Desulfovibrio sp. UCD-KL4C]|uniref:DinB family protein n=1 Tax=Desulfovibrio sp. UCD-KL4C TaxID=2578120 RepID=UPI0025B7B26E|nr:DinB family protein [Desulfovibrio sp. UCD-KL4C]
MIDFQHKPDCKAILRGLSDTHTILSAFIAAIPEKDLYAKRGENFWSIAEHLAHLAGVQPMGLERITRILDEDTPEFVPFFPDEDETLKTTSLPTIAESLSDFKKGRTAIVERLTEAIPEDWKRLAVHPEYKQYGLHIFARHIFMHDYWHMYRMEELWLTRDAYLKE